MIQVGDIYTAQKTHPLNTRSGLSIGDEFEVKSINQKSPTCTSIICCTAIPTKMTKRYNTLSLAGGYHLMRWIQADFITLIQQGILIKTN